jgi:hypothetical protein
MHHPVPKAPDVAGSVHHLVPGAAGAVDDGPSALACPHTGEACPALGALFGSLTPSSDDARAWVQSLAPCGRCRVASEEGCKKLRHLRLGQREREILLATSVGGVFAVTEPGMSRSVSAARRRAALSLGKAGLVAPVAAARSKGPPGAARPARATVALTELGAYVMAAYGRFIKDGKPIRWTRPARGVALPGSDPAGLTDEALARTETALRDTLDELKGVLVAVIARPTQDPGRLDTITRHLERKATLLKSVLAPARAR